VTEKPPVRADADVRMQAEPEGKEPLGAMTCQDRFTIEPGSTVSGPRLGLGKQRGRWEEEFDSTQTLVIFTCADVDPGLEPRARATNRVTTTLTTTTAMTRGRGPAAIGGGCGDL